MSYLLQPLDTNLLRLKNRLVMPPMATAKATSEGKVSEDILDYYNEKSNGGYVSLIIIEHSFISSEGKASANQLSVADDSTIEELRKLSDIIHHNGSKAIIQINHAGVAAKEEIIGTTPVGPSNVPHPFKEGTPRELTISEIDEIIKKFADAALRVKAAGFDGVEIHSAHGYLLYQFFSPLTNKREDEYGGNVLNRINIHLKVIKAVREAVGDNFPILLRLGASDFIEGGVNIEDSIIAAKEFEKAGIEILDISGGFKGYFSPNSKEQGYFSPLTDAIKKEISIPVILTGGIIEEAAAEKLLVDGKADLIGVGRAILNDSKWAEKAVNSLK